MSMERRQPTSQLSAWGICKRHKKAYSSVVIITILLSLLYSYSQPNEYDARLKFSIDTSEDLTSGKNKWLHNLTHQFGLDGALVTAEPEIYTTILRSQAFLQGVADVRITTDEGQRKRFADYIREDCEAHWWTSALSWASRKETKAEQDADVIDLLRSKYLLCELNRRNGLITMQATAQHPRIAAEVLDSAFHHLQAFLTQYLHQSAKGQNTALKQNKELMEQRYKQAMSRYSQFLDTHLETTRPSVEAEEDYLRKELTQAEIDFADAQLTYVQSLRKEVRQRSLIFQVNSITTPNAPARPAYLLNLFVWLFYALLLTTWVVFFREKRQRPT